MAIVVTSKEQAWEEVNKLFPTDYEKDEAASRRAGYDIYRHNTLNYYSRICDLGNRIEVLTGEYGENVTNVWIVPESEEVLEAPVAKKENYGSELSYKIRSGRTDFSNLTDYEKFIIDNGFKYKTEEALKAGYDRSWKCRHDIALTFEEFAAEARDSIYRDYDLEVLESVYDAISSLISKDIMKASSLYSYAYYKWCLLRPEAIVAVRIGRKEWAVNNCGTRIIMAQAIANVNKEWGFEASRIEIIGKPYYDATDWQFIRFNCAGIAWLWRNGELNKVWE